MTRLAKGYTPAELAVQAYPLYERIRPSIPAGKPGWGAKGTLDLELIGRLAAARTSRKAGPKPAPEPAVTRPGRR